MACNSFSCDDQEYVEPQRDVLCDISKIEDIVEVTLFFFLGCKLNNFKKGQERSKDGEYWEQRIEPVIIVENVRLSHNDVNQEDRKIY